jgi:mono/diheme cytochrome c family protein
MKGIHKGISFGLAAVLCLFGAVGVFAQAKPATPDEDKPWVAPDDARKVKNPIAPTPQNLAAAAQLFHDNCAGCHGDKGLGDGPTSKILKKKPANFTDPKLQSSETDGSLFWKMTEGRLPMPTWKDDLSDDERWQLVNYIRQLGKPAPAAK